MAPQVDLLVNGVKMRFFFIAACKDSMIPSYMVPAGELRRKPTVQLQGARGELLKMIGTYEAMLEPVPEQAGGASFNLHWLFSVVHVPCPEEEHLRFGVLGGNDFERNWLVVSKTRDALEIESPTGSIIRMPLVTERPPPGVRVPTLRRASDDLVPPASYAFGEHPGVVRASRVVVFDLEPPGFFAEVLQVAAKYGDKALNVRVLQDGDVPPHITQETGWHKRDGELFLRDAKQDAVSAEQAVERLLDFLREEVGGDAVLVAHNAFSNDGVRLERLVAKAGRWRDFASLVRGFAGTLPLFRDTMPEREEQGKEYTLEALAKDFLNGGHGDDDVHDAEAGVRALERLMRLAGMTKQKMIACARPLSAYQWCH